MKWYWIKTNWIIRLVFSKFIWKIKTNQKKIYLTFDDGPTPFITEWVLDLLKKYNCRATFFCIGNNIEEYPEIANKIINDQHLLANHTFNHLNGWKTNCKTYIDSIIKCQNSLEKLNFNSKKNYYFRPPYGKITNRQTNLVLQLGYKIVMWDVLSADFDENITKEKCLQNVINNISSGSIIVFHDSQKAFKNLEYVLPETLKYLKQYNYFCESLPKFSN